MKRTCLVIIVTLGLMYSCKEENDEIIPFTGDNQKNCLILDGVDDYGSISYNDNLDFNNELTIEARFYVGFFNEPTGSKWRLNETSETILPIISQSHSNSSIGDFTLAITPTRVLFGFETLDSRYAADFLFEEKTWYSIAVVHKLGHGDSIKLYINGELLNGEWRDDNGNLIDGNNFSVPNTHNPYWIGTNQNHGDAGRFNGCIDDMGIWHELRTQEQIAADFEEGIDLTNDNLVSFWNFNNVTENVISDLKNSNDISLKAGAKVIEE